VLDPTITILWPIEFVLTATRVVEMPLPRIMEPPMLRVWLLTMYCEFELAVRVAPLTVKGVGVCRLNVGDGDWIMEVLPATMS